MSTRAVPSTRAARAGGRPLARAAALVLLAFAALPAAAQTWERLPLVRPQFNPEQRVPAVDFLRGEGTAAADPAADTLVLFHEFGTYLYNPGGAAGAGDNGIDHPWYRLCFGGACNARAGLVTTAGTILKSTGSLRSGRATGRGRVWTHSYDDYGRDPYIQLLRAAPVGAVIAGTGDDGQTRRSLADGAPGTWDAPAGTCFGFPESFGEVPPSLALPQGRILCGVWNGALYSDDGGLSYRPSSAYGFARYIVWSFAFADVPGHRYGGVTYAGVQNLATAEGGGEGRGAEVLRSDDGGATWTRAHRFTAAEMDLPVPANTDVSEVVVFATPGTAGAPGGVLWAGVRQSGGATNPPHAGILRSVDGGATWQRADAGFRNAEGWGPGVFQFRLSRTGVLYAATWIGAWRTTAPVVAGEAGPAEVPAVPLGVTVRPNPAGGRVEVAVTLAEAGPVRVVVVDALGREVAVVLDGAAGAGERVVGVETASWPAGVYVVRATAGARAATARLVVAR